MHPCVPPIQRRPRARAPLGLFTTIAAVVTFTLLGGCNKPAPACEKLKSCCDALASDPPAYAATDAAKVCATFVTVYPKNPTTGEVPGEPFCESVASDFPTSFVKASKPPPPACK